MESETSSPFTADVVHRLRAGGPEADEIIDAVAAQVAARLLNQLDAENGGGWPVGKPSKVMAQTIREFKVALEQAEKGAPQPRRHPHGQRLGWNWSRW